MGIFICQTPFCSFIASLGILRYDLIKGLQYLPFYGGIGVKPIDVPSHLADIRYDPFRQR